MSVAFFINRPTSFLKFTPGNTPPGKFCKKMVQICSFWWILAVTLKVFRGWIFLYFFCHYKYLVRKCLFSQIPLPSLSSAILVASKRLLSFHSLVSSIHRLLGRPLLLFLSACPCITVTGQIFKLYIQGIILHNVILFICTFLIF